MIAKQHNAAIPIQTEQVLGKPDAPVARLYQEIL
jgi:hypothetical protein